MRNFLRAATPITLALAVLFAGTSGCRRQASSDDEPLDTSTYRPLATPETEFEQKLKIVRDARFEYIWVFTRLDGKEFTPEDSELLRTNAPKVVDWVGMDDKKTYIAGSYFPIESKNLQLLQRRYKIEDYSKTKE